MRLCVVGAGYVGLVTGTCLAALGHDVTCQDNDCRKIDTLRAGGIPIFEPGLEPLIAANVAAGRLSFSADLAASLRGARALFIAVGTPSREADGSPDLSAVYAVTRAAASALEADAVVVLKSTVPLGTGDEVERILREARPDCGISVASNPEFLRAGSAVRDFQHPDRIVVGTEDEHAREVLDRIYQPIVTRNTPIVHTSRRSSELIKYSANALLATRIAFINEIAELCERADADVQEVARGIGLDHRIGSKFLEAGPGFGGSCFRKDALALALMGESHCAPMRIVEAVLAANEARKRALARKVAAALVRPLRGATVAVLGLTFKPNTDDMREAPSIPLIAALVDAGAQVRAYDPVGMAAAKALLPPGVVYARSAYEAVRGADGLVVMTEWTQLRTLDLARVAKLLNTPVMIDLRNLYDAEDAVDGGLHYHGVGAAPRRPPHALAPVGRRAQAHSRNGAGNATDHLLPARAIAKA